MRSSTSAILQYVPFSTNLPTVMLARVERIKSRLQSYLAGAKDVYTRIVENLDGTQLMMPSTAVYNIINPRRACAARVTVVVLSVCLSVCASSRTTGYEAANEWYQRVVNNEKMDKLTWRFFRNDCVPEIWCENK